MKSEELVRNDQGAAMLVVVVIMTLVLLMASILLNFGIRNYRYQYEYINIVQRQELADAAINESIASVFSLLDTDTSFEHLQVNNTSPFLGESGYEYTIDIYNDTFYDTDDYVEIGSQRQYTLKRDVETAEELLYGDIAIEIIANYQGEEISKKILISAEKTADDYIQLRIKKCL